MPACRFVWPRRGAHVATASFIVDPAGRGRGVGRALGDYMLEWASAAGFRAVHSFDHPRDGFVGLQVMHRRLS